jgi:hypothetical protein
VTGPVARKLFVLIVVGLWWAGLNGPSTQLHAEPPRSDARGERTVFLVGEQTDEERIVCTAAIAAARHPGVILFDTAAARPHLARFLQEFEAELVHPVGRFDPNDDLSARLACPLGDSFLTRNDRPGDLWRFLFPKADRIVVCPAVPRSLLLQAAALAAAAQAPLFVLHPQDGEFDLRPWVETWKVGELLAVAEADRFCRVFRDITVRRFADESNVQTASVSFLTRRERVRTLVVANPEDPKCAALAPWIAVEHQAALILTSPHGGDVGELVGAAVTRPELRCVDQLLLLADRKAIPMERRPNPLQGKDAEIEMEPMTPGGTMPFSFATGRLFGADRGSVALQLARQRVLQSRGARRALVASNPGGGLPLLETLSRHSALELKNRGFETTAMFGTDVHKEDVRRTLAESELFLWEGHHATLVKEYGFLQWNEPLKPGLVVLQSCLALNEETALPLLQRGSVAVVGSSTRTYSGSGGAFSLAFLDALLYEGQSLGGALRDAKNFLLCYQLLKEKRLGSNARLCGANLRSAWAFTLWGDPTFHFPLPSAEPELATLQHSVKRLAHKADDGESTGTHTVTFEIPATAYGKVGTVKYQAMVVPNMRLAGLIRPGDEEAKSLVPFLFAEVCLPTGPAGKLPQLRGRLPEDHWVFTWDSRRRAGYLLVLPRAKDVGEVKFTVAWVAPDPVKQ